MAIDIGPGATNRKTFANTGLTVICKNNPANDDGSLDTIEVWAYSNISGMKVGTFYGSGTSWTRRDSETIGSVSSGSKQTFTGKSCDVETGDLLGAWWDDGFLETTITGGGGRYIKAEDQFNAGTQTYTDQADIEHSIYATNAETSVGLPLAQYHYNNMRP